VHLKIFIFLFFQEMCNFSVFYGSNIVYTIKKLSTAAASA